jgi:hypothetical protein
MLAAEADAATVLQKKITDLAVEFRLVSQFTAFVAVDESRVVGNGQPLRVMQPVEVPAGTSYERVFGELPVGEVFEVGAWGLTVQQTESGKVKVGAVQSGSRADRSGIQPGATILAVDRTSVHDLVHLQGLLLQTPGTTRVEFDPGGTVELPRP